MLLPVFRDLIKPHWRVVLEELKITGGMPVSELAKCTGGSYMAVKTHCEELTKSGYLVRTRLPRTGDQALAQLAVSGCQRRACK